MENVDTDVKRIKTELIACMFQTGMATKTVKDLKFDVMYDNYDMICLFFFLRKHLSQKHFFNNYITGSFSWSSSTRSLCTSTSINFLLESKRNLHPSKHSYFIRFTVSTHSSVFWTQFSWKTRKIIEFYLDIFQDWKVLEKDYKSWKVLEINKVFRNQCCNKCMETIRRIDFEILGMKGF